MKKRSSTRKRSIAQEDGVALRLGGQRVQMSGAGDRKGDAELERFLVECKFTEAQSFRLEAKTFLKIKKEAVRIGKMPMLCVQVGGLNLVVIEECDVEEVVSLSAPAGPEASPSPRLTAFAKKQDIHFTGKWDGYGLCGSRFEIGGVTNDPPGVTCPVCLMRLSKLKKKGD